MAKQAGVAYQGLVVDVGDADYIDLKHIGDLHLGDANCDIDAIRETVAWVLADSEHRYLTIGGDVVNAALANSKSDVYKDVMDVDHAMDAFCELFAPVRKNILAVIEGNHDRRVEHSVGVDPVKWCCNKLQAPYRHGECFLTICVGNWAQNRRTKGKKRSPVRYHVYMNHGRGGGATVGGAINSAAKHRNVVVADLYLSAHTHKPSVTPYAIYEFSPRTGAVIAREQYVVVCNSYLKRAGYPTEMGLSPTSEHSPVVRLDGHEKKMSASI